MRALGTTLCSVLLLSLWASPARSQSQDRVAATQDAKKVEGKTIVIDLPPIGKQVDLPMDPGRHTTLIFDDPVKRVIGDPRGAVAKPVKNRANRVAIWPQSIIPDFPERLVEPLGGNFGVELNDGRTLVISVFEPTDLKQAILLATVRSTPGEVQTLQQKVKEAQDDAASAREAAAKARREANEAKRKAQAAESRARRALTRAEARVKKAEAETASVKADVAKAKEAAAKAEAEAAQARADAEEARAAAAEAITRAEAAEAERDQAIGEMLLHAAQELVNEGSYKLLPEGGVKEMVRGALGITFQRGTWQDGYFILQSELRAHQGRPFQVGAIKVRTRTRELIPARVVMPQVPAHSSDGAILSVVPGRNESVVFAIEFPVDEDVAGATLELHRSGSESPPVVFQIPRYPDGVILYPETEEQKQRRLWAKQVVIGPRAALGGCWLVSGMDGDEELSTARCGVVGLAISKGYHSYFAAGVEATVGWTGDAEFDRDPSPISRNAKLFRILGYGDLRFSHGKVVPYLRLGVGLHATRYGGTNSETDILGSFAAGGGVQYRLGEHFRITGGGSFTWTGEKVRTIQADVHLGYGWN